MLVTEALAPPSIIALASVELSGESQQGVVVVWRWMPSCFSSFSSTLTLVAIGVSPDDPAQAEGDSTGAIVGGLAGAKVGSCGLLVTSAPLAKPVKAPDGTATDPNDTCVGSIDGMAGGTGGTPDGFVAGAT